jgi:hypothetical protein
LWTNDGRGRRSCNLRLGWHSWMRAAIHASYGSRSCGQLVELNTQQGNDQWGWGLNQIFPLFLAREAGYLCCGTDSAASQRQRTRWEPDALCLGPDGGLRFLVLAFLRGCSAMVPQKKAARSANIDGGEGEDAVAIALALLPKKVGGRLQCAKARLLEPRRIFRCN